MTGPVDSRPSDDGVCANCRRGHYAMKTDGMISNFPCTTAGCTCWFCGPVVTDAQAEAWAAHLEAHGEAPA